MPCIISNQIDAHLQSLDDSDHLHEACVNKLSEQLAELDLSIGIYALFKTPHENTLIHEPDHTGAAKNGIKGAKDGDFIKLNLVELNTFLCASYDNFLITENGEEFSLERAEIELLNEARGI